MVFGMRRLLFACCLSLPALLLPGLAVPGLVARAWAQAPAPDRNAPQPGAPAGQSFQVLNRTGSVATALHAVRSGNTSWGNNLIEGRGMRPGQSATVTARPGAGCVFDVRLVLLDRPAAERRGVDICQEQRVEFTQADLSGPQARPGGTDAQGKPTPGAGIEPIPGVAALPRPAQPPGQQPGQPQGAPRNVSSGTGFIVAEGRALTNHHVIDECARVIARNSAGRDMQATVVARDRELDLAILTLPRDAGPALPFRDPPDMRRGEEVVTYGFPLSGLLSSGPTLTRGDISALAGLRDNQAHYQISAPVQPGNSGGPLLDRAGNVVGVVVSKLNAQRVAQQTGDLPQNVNFAIRGERAVRFLRANGVTPLLATSRTERPAAEVGDIAHPSTLFLRCQR
jgi:S1-C subfamily serine protease